MILLYRARLFFLGAVVAAAVLLVLELPVTQILHQRGALGSAEQELASVQARNASLRADIAALRQDSAIAAIAHEEYGLVRPGQQSYVILPGRTSARSSQGALGGAGSIPAADLVLTPSSTTPAATATAAQGSFVGRMLSRLEFWRWAF